MFTRGGKAPFLFAYPVLCLLATTAQLFVRSRVKALP